MTTDPITEAVARAIERTWCDSDEELERAWADAEIQRHNRLIEARAAIRALYGALEREGWQVVPREADEEMARKGEANGGHIGFPAQCTYRAMLAAAPKPPGAET